MRKSLLSLCLLALCALGMQAQSWQAPTLQYSTEIPSSGYIYNVEQAKFLTKGGAWGSHAAIKADASDALLYQMQDQGDGVYKLYGSNSDYLGRQDETEVYTDYNDRSGWSCTWEFVMGDNGLYRIRTAYSSDNWGAKNYTEESDVNYGLYELGWNPEGQDLTNGTGDPMGTNDGCYMVDPTNCEGWSMDWAFVTTEVYELYAAQLALYNKLQEAFEMGYTESELSQYAAALTSTDADAVTTAKAAVDELILNYAYNHATPDNPYDITSKIVNPTFEGTKGYTASGWTDENDNMHIQNNSAYHLWDDEAGAASSTEYGLNNFAQNWTSSNSEPIAASNIYQTIANLPQGTYILQADCIATSGSTSLTVSGAELYAVSGSIRYACAIDKNPYGETGSGYPHRYQMTVVHQGGDLTIGYGFTPGYVKWFACDNFKLYYAGAVDNPGLVALSGTITSVQPYVEGFDDTYFYSETTYESLKSELDAAMSLTSGGTSEECLAESKKLTDMLADVKSEVNAYAQLKALIEKSATDAAAYTTSIPTLAEQLSDEHDKYEDAYNDKTATIEQIEAWVAAYDDIVVAGVKAALADATAENPIDISVLGKNMSYAENSSTEGWTATTGSAGNSGSYAVSYHVGEVWSNTFSCLQTIDNLPSGAYILRAKSFYRTSDNATNYSDYKAGNDQILTYLVVGDGKAPVINQAAGAVEASEAPYTGYAETSTGSGIWVPNSMQSAEYAFNLDDTYACQAECYLAEDGSLTFGIRNDELTDGNGWSIWGQFHLYYCGKSNDGLYAQVIALAEQATAKQDEAGIIAAASDKLNTAVAASENVSAASSEEELMNVMEQLKSAIAYADEGVTLIDELMSKYETYNEQLANYESNDPALPEAIENIGMAISDEEFESNEQIQGWLDNLGSLWTGYIMYDHMQATEQAPEDVSAVLLNNSFQDNSTTGWSYTYTNGSPGGSDTQRTSSTAYEFWNSNAFDIHQTVRGLANGYYRLRVKAFFRNGNNTTAVLEQYLQYTDSINNLMHFYANTDSVCVQSYYTGAQTEVTGADGETSYTLDGVTYYVPNTMISFESYAMDLDLYTNELVIEVKDREDVTIGLRMASTASYTWAPFDEFTVEYLGTAAPTAVEGVKSSEFGVKSIYDLSGRRVTRTQHGIYIVNGKKVIR